MLRDDLLSIPQPYPCRPPSARDHPYRRYLDLSLHRTYLTFIAARSSLRTHNEGPNMQVKLTVAKFKHSISLHADL